MSKYRLLGESPHASDQKGFRQARPFGKLSSRITSKLGENKRSTLPVQVRNFPSRTPKKRTGVEGVDHSCRPCFWPVLASRTRTCKCAGLAVSGPVFSATAGSSNVSQPKAIRLESVKSTNLGRRLVLLEVSYPNLPRFTS